eukprot:CAMPEP_0119009352 /NCGR_PEP_ID=MMETSP1176-20130426/4310_1 /TAXON_ID=265551 /ORGANISM="Synedropsis recta cf, Strain CCMP1620" /LENGTH=673 /DNA_ID=CAMNT_0006961857 /DNA_START=17 /DNA_END=2038 /DNA_ORIENTATION=+
MKSTMLSNTAALLLLLATTATVSVLGQGNSVNPGNSGKGPDRFPAKGTIYQQRATVWLTQFPVSDAPSILQSVQRYALACIYFATYQEANKYTAVESTEAWKDETNWMSDEPECDWYGITCNELDQIIMLELGDNNLAGVFPLEVQVLGASLEVLDISENPIASLSGALVWLSSFTNLKMLDVHFTNLDYAGIPPWLAEMTSLEFIDMSYTFFYGPIDGEIFTPLQNLTYLEMGGNYYEFGSVPTEIASLPKLDHLYMDYTSISGNMDFVELMNPDMFEMWFDLANFAGPIPESIGNLTGLVSLSLTGCGLTETIPSVMGELINLKQLWLYNNSLTGDIPSALGDLVNLTTFQTEDNMMDGSTMPAEICALVQSGDLDALSTDCDGTNPPVQCDADCCHCCKSPCFPPAPPPPAFGGFCFSGENSVDLLDGTTIAMHQLQIGDEVHVGNGDYSTVYSFGHYNKDQRADYLQLHSANKQPLELSADHMVFVQDRGAVAAATIKVGDKLVLGSSTASSTSTITKISQVQRTGAYAPFTHAGSICVNDVVASSYVSLQDNSNYFSVGGIKVVNMHLLAHVFQAPHRVMSKLVLTDAGAAETYTIDGISNWVYGPYLASQWLLNQHVVVFAAISIPLLALAAGLYAVETYGFVLVLGAAALVAYRRRSSSGASKMAA